MIEIDGEEGRKRKKDVKRFAENYFSVILELKITKNLKIIWDFYLYGGRRVCVSDEK